MKTPTPRQYDMNNFVMSGKGSMRDAASLFSVSLTTVRNALDAVSDFERETFQIELTGAELKQVLGWLRNGNTSSAELADKIESM